MILLSDFVEKRYGPAIEDTAPGVPRIVLRADGASGDPQAASIAYFSGDLYPDRAREFWVPLLKGSALRWLHSYSAGVDHPVFQTMLDRGAILTTSSGAAAVPIAHTVLLYLLALSRDLPGWLGSQSRRAWEPRLVGDLQGRVLGVIGLGPIGIEVARLGAAFGMRVVGMRRRARGDEPCETWPLERLRDLLAIADDVVLALPLADETRHLLNAETLAHCKPGARLVNVGRGELVDEPALIAALAEGRLSGAGLDVFETEPLPADSPLWTMPNVIVTPHAAGNTPGNTDRETAIFLDNLGRFLRGEPLRNQVQPKSAVP